MIFESSRPEATILLAEDNPAERALAKRACERSRINCDLRFVNDGEQALDYLYRKSDFADPAVAPVPDLVLLDLNMPKVNGHQVLSQMKLHHSLKKIPVVVLTTSRAERDIAQSYEIGCNSFLNKPKDVDSFVDLFQSLSHYWFNLVVLPPKDVE
ncbi:response regulator [Stieleria sp. JC731]|uniref:response regulator n=1 Tax=Pirellulaceae TaxID=2691357 RepID=UPI001E368594|nr:response regulator [Stieleria sp. JC731]MCC9599535.1 response regulator [Stieleria sp. JC731]